MNEQSNIIEPHFEHWPSHKVRQPRDKIQANGVLQGLKVFEPHHEDEMEIIEFMGNLRELWPDNVFRPLVLVDEEVWEAQHVQPVAPPALQAGEEHGQAT